MHLRVFVVCPFVFCCGTVPHTRSINDVPVVAVCVVLVVSFFAVALVVLVAPAVVGFFVCFCKVNISGECRDTVLATDVTAYDIFDEARAEVLLVMEVTTKWDCKTHQIEPPPPPFSIFTVRLPHF